MAHPDTHSGLISAFEMGAQGKSHREIARALNSAGHRTTKGHPFSKDTVDDILRNRFYLGELPVFNGNSDAVEWVPSRHEPLVSRELFEAAWIKDQRVVAVTPRPELKPFFDLRNDGLSGHVL